MILDFKQLYKKYENIILYLFFGICTTLVNIGAYWVSAHLLSLNIMSSTLIAWLLAVLFAYTTNRKWVFHSKSKGCNAILIEILSFFACRLATGLVDWLCMFIFVGMLTWNDMFIKSAANILVIILNYVASKLVIFKKR